MAEQEGTSAVEKACRKNYVKQNIQFCNEFVIAVTIELGYPVLGRADDIVDHIERYWLKVESGREAARHAAEGTIAIAGLRARQHADKKAVHGHVAIVVPGDLDRDIYPRVWCGGSYQAQSQGNKSVGQVWRLKDRDNVHYYRAPALSK